MSNRLFVMLATTMGLCIMATLGLIFFTGWTVNRSEEVEQTRESARSEPASITAGVILADAGSLYGWPNSGDFVETRIGSHRVIVYDNLNPEQRPDTTLDTVISGMLERGARYIFLSTTSLSNEGETALRARYASAVFILNLSTYDDVVSLLPTLATTRPDIERLSAAVQPARVDSESTNRSTLWVAIMVVSVNVVIFSLIMAFFLLRSKSFTTSGSPMSQWLYKLSEWQEANSRRKKKRRASGPLGKELAIQRAAAERQTDFAALGEPQPLLYKLTTYVQGDLHFDESFAIEASATAPFFGECGIVRAASVNQYDKSRVAAFEVWLFDKNDIRTASAMLITERIDHDERQKAELAKRGTPVLAAPDAVFELETKTLRLRARILDMQYGFSDTLPQDSFFDYLVLELAVWRAQA